MTLLPTYYAEDTCLKNPAVTDSEAGFRPPVGRNGDDAFVESRNNGPTPDASNAVAEKPVDSQETLWVREHDDSGVTAEKSKDLDGQDGIDRSYATDLELARPLSALSFPEGGLEAWLVVFGSFCAMFVVFGLINSAGVFESYFATHQLSDSSPSQLGWIFSLYLFIVFFVGIQVGPAFDRYGPRILVALGSLLSVASLVLVGFCQEYYQIILTYSVLGGLGGALLNTPAYGSIAHFFNAKRGFATGVATTSGGIGGILFPILLQNLLPRLGFAWSTRILGLMLLVLVIPANLFLKTRLPPRKGPNAKTSVWPDLSVFRDLRFALCALGIWFMEWGLFVPLTFIVSYASAHGQDATSSYTLVALLNAGSVVGRLVPGIAADRLGRFNVIIVTISLCAATIFGLWVPAGESRSLLLAFTLVFGFVSGSNLGLIPVCLGQLCDPREYGRYYATAMMLASFGTLSSVPIGGLLLGIGGQTDENNETGWLALRLFAGIAYALALVCYTTTRVLAVGWRFRTVF